jgi:hypothetical protein
VKTSRIVSTRTLRWSCKSRVKSAKRLVVTAELTYSLTAADYLEA